MDATIQHLASNAAAAAEAKSPSGEWQEFLYQQQLGEWQAHESHALEELGRVVSQQLVSGENNCSSSSSGGAAAASGPVEPEAEQDAVTEGALTGGPLWLHESDPQKLRLLEDDANVYNRYVLTHNAEAHKRLEQAAP